MLRFNAMNGFWLIFRVQLSAGLGFVYAKGFFLARFKMGSMHSYGAVYTWR